MGAEKLTTLLGRYTTPRRPGTLGSAHDLVNLTLGRQLTSDFDEFKSYELWGQRCPEGAEDGR